MRGRVSSMAIPRPPEFLLALAPLRLPNHRKERYLGDNLNVTLEQLAPGDRMTLHGLYAVLSELLFVIVDKSTDDVRKWQEVVQRTQRHNLDELIREVQELGTVSRVQNTGEALAKAMHDVRGGALSALLGRLQLLDRMQRNEKQLQTLFVLVRDHLKIMRSAVVGLDEPRRHADRQPKSHDVFLILEKWHESVVGPKWHERPVRMFMDCRYQGALTACCLESAAIDRIFYNLANNACRHSVGERLDMVIFPIPEPPGECLRFVLSNQIAAGDAAYLQTLQAGHADGVDYRREQNLRALFEPKVSSTGSGFGLTVVADFVAEAFGLKDRTEALSKRYVGAILDDRTFRVWFHWPLAGNNAPPKLDDLHQPERSLSEP